MTEATESKLIELFWDGIADWSWDDWCSTGANDREEIVANAISELGVTVDVDEAYELFYDWSSGLEESHFEDEFDEYGDEEE